MTPGLSLGRLRICHPDWALSALKALTGVTALVFVVAAPGAGDVAALPPEPCLSFVSILKVDPITTVPTNTELRLHGIAMCAPTSVGEDTAGAPLTHEWMLVKQPATGSESLVVSSPDPQSPGDLTTTQASFMPILPGEYIVRLAACEGGDCAKTGRKDEVRLTVIDLPPSAPGDPAPEYWRSLGPAGVVTPVGAKAPFRLDSGQVNALAVSRVDPAQPATLYAGSASGGLWTSRDGGGSWTQATDNQLVRNGRGTSAVGAIAIDPGDPAVVYVGTESSKCCTDAFGRRALGVFRSVDGGATWTPTGTGPICDNGAMQGGGQFDQVDKVVIDPARTATIYAATNRGLFQSDDRGDCWIRQGKQPGLEGSPLPALRVTDVVLDPQDPRIVYAAFSGIGIFKRTVVAGRPPVLAWMPLDSGLPSAASFLRIALGISPSNPRILYAGFESTGTVVIPSGETSKTVKRYDLFKTVDGGQTWQNLFLPAGFQRCDNQCSHNNTVVVHPTDPDIVFVGLVPLLRSTDGGMTWVDISGPAVDRPVKGLNIHGDNHALVFDPLEASVMYLADDGGVTKGVSEGGVLTWTPLTKGLVIGQFRTIGIASSDPKVVAGGVWHNSNFRLVVSPEGTTSATVLGRGDGSQTKIDAGDSRIVYYDTNAVFNGNISRFNAGTKEDKEIYIATGGTVHWTDPFRKGHLLLVDFFDGGLRRIKDADTTALAASIVKAPIGPPMGNGTIQAVTFETPATATDNPVYYVGTAGDGIAVGGEIWRGEPDGPGWTLVCSAAVCGQQVVCVGSACVTQLQQVTGLASDPNNRNRLFATFTGNSPGGVRLCERDTGGWTCKQIDNPFTPGITTPARFQDIVVDPKVADTVYVATDQGIYRGRRASAGAPWTWSVSPGVPADVEVTDLELHQGPAGSSGAVRAATWGRGVWDLVRLTSTPVLVDESIAACETPQLDDPELKDRYVVIRTEYRYRPERGPNIQMRARVLRNGRPAPFFATTVSPLIEPQGAAVLVVGYVRRWAPLALATDAVVLEMGRPGQPPFASTTCPVQVTWKREGSRTLQIAAYEVGREGGTSTVYPEILLTSPTRQATTLVAPFEEVVVAGTELTVRAPLTIARNGETLVFANWVVDGGQATTEPTITVTATVDRSLNATYRSSP